MSGYSDQFATDLLNALGEPVTAANKQFLAAWAQAEGGTASYNPFNTTQTEPGATAYNNNNGHPVESYASYSSGLAATVKTLTNGLYTPILNALGQGNSAMADAQAEAQTPWGTGTLIEQVLGGTVGPVPATSSPGSAGSATDAADITGQDALFNPFSGNNAGGVWNPFNLPSEVANGIGGVAGKAASAGASATVAGVEGIITKLVPGLKGYIEDAFLVLFGFVMVIVGLVLLAHATSSSAGAAQSAPSAAPAEPSKPAAGGGAAEDAALA